MHANVALDISSEARADRGQWLLEWANGADGEEGWKGRRGGVGWVGAGLRVSSRGDFGNEAKLKKGWRRMGRYIETESGAGRRNENRDGHYCAPVCDSLSARGNIRSRTISHLGTKLAESGEGT